MLAGMSTNARLDSSNADPDSWFKWAISQNEDLSVDVSLWPIKADPTAKSIFPNKTIGEAADLIKEWYTTLKLTPSEHSRVTLNRITRDNFSKKHL